MKLYIAGIYTANFNIGGNLYNRLTENEKYQRDQCTNILESYHYVHKEKYVEKMRADRRKVFLDSGAFSAHTQGVNIDIDAFIQYIKKNEDIIERVDSNIMASVLDGIGDPLKTYQNQLYMESRGVRPLPCFHYGEDERYLEYYMANYDYITIGGMVPIAKPQLKIWLDRIWEKHLIDGAGRPKIRVHGFGLTSIPFMQRYPWYSVDSSSWVQVARTGGMTLLDGRVVHISKDSPKRHDDGQHLDTFTPPQRAEIIRQLESCGVDIERCQKLYLGRWTYNIYAFCKIGERMAIKDKRYKKDMITLFG